MTSVELQKRPCATDVAHHRDRSDARPRSSDEEAGGGHSSAGIEEHRNAERASRQGGPQVARPTGAEPENSEEMPGGKEIGWIDPSVLLVLSLLQSGDDPPRWSRLR